MIKTLLIAIVCSVVSVLYKPISASNSSSPTKDCSCGKDISLRGRIIGGAASKQGEFPWQAGFFNDKSFFCGGSIINDNYVLTAAHCFKTADPETQNVTDVSKENISIILGGHSLDSLKTATKDENGPDIRHPKSILLHPFYDPFKFYCDIALIKLEKPIKEYSFNILPVCLPPDRLSFEKVEVTVSGWGASMEGGGTSKNLQKVDIRVLTNEECEDKLQQYFKKDVMMCASAPGHDACQGDSGGPLVQKEKLKYTQIGVVSYGIGCGDTDYPGVYTRLNRFTKWIEKQTEDASYCKN